MAGKIVVRGARVHNLKNIDLEIPRGQFVVITGVSGSGKSSLAFDTLYAEGQRRYLESLAADARQFLKRLEKPDVDFIEGLSPAIAVQQGAAFLHRRSTVGTATEIYDYLRLLFARVGEAFCTDCGQEIKAQTTEQIVDQLLALAGGTRMLILAPITRTGGGEAPARLEELAREGFTRVRIAGRLCELSDALRFVDAGQAVDLVVDRLVIRDGIAKRLADSLEIAARFGDHVIKVEAQPAGDGTVAHELLFSQRFVCVRCGVSLPEISPGLFSFNSPEGACPLCAGLGTASGARKARAEDDQQVDRQTCQACAGARLKKESLAVKVGGKNIAQVAALPAAEALEYIRALEFSPGAAVVGEKIAAGIVTRLNFLAHVGLDYLSLDRPSVTLSSGELQRVRLANQIGAELAGVLYILDEPSVGLHQRDNQRLLALLKKLRDRGNSVIVVEHDPETIFDADYVIDMGPGAGAEGGAVVAQGTPSDLARDSGSLTGQYLSGGLRVPVPPLRRKGSGAFLVVQGARQHNLKNLTVAIPVGVMTCVTGVSGSGKSSLVMDILFNAMAARLHHAKAPVGLFDELLGWQNFDRVVGVDQAPIGRTPRANAATYTGLYDHIRDLFAQLPEARVRGYDARRFSFNVSGGRCEACAGDGVVRVEMYFLPEIFVTCDVCKGKRYNRETLGVRYKGLSIADVLALSVIQALELFGNIPAVYERLTALRDVGLGYLRLGQPASTLSGGEAQRVKLARELARRSTGRSLYILDEPTTGLHFHDVRQLLELLHRLVEAGNTMVVIEHNLDVIKTADHVIEIGPGGGAHGGEIILAGTPEDIAASAGSPTGHYLKSFVVPTSKLAAHP